MSTRTAPFLCLLAFAAPWSCANDDISSASDAQIPGADLSEDIGARDLGSAGPDVVNPLDATTLPQVTFRVTVPADTPEFPAVYVAGDFQGWQPLSEPHRLTRKSPELWEGTLSIPLGLIAYKYVRGTWLRVEKGPRGEELGDRSVEVNGDLQVEDTVASWADRPPRPSTIVGDVRSLEALGRTVLVYLPPGYETSGRTYPVLYMFDGQNVFDAATSFAGEWGADEAAEQLIAAGEIEALIIVAIANGGAQRLEEYTPWRDADFSTPGGGGQAHLQRIVQELKPTVDARFRTDTAPQRTAIAGSSLGGLMAAYALHAHPDVFGRAAALSPSIWWDDRRLLRFVETTGRPDGAWAYADMGTGESGGVPALRALRDAWIGVGFTAGTDLFVEEISGGVHNEASWRARFPDILRRLFPAPE
ncbi:MAG: alpha/beta hydrolase-fold protein [Myxococcota bacterium]